MSGPRIGSLFSGYGGLERGVQEVLGGTVAWHSEIDPGACKILAHRYPDVPNLGDITAVDWSQVKPVDVLTGGFPCTDVSGAGLRKGLTPDTRSGLWTQMAHAISQLRPSLVIIENVRGLLSATAEHPAHGDVEPCAWELGDGSSPTLRALGAVLGDLADIGFDAEWVGVRASDIGAPHQRFRVFVAAWPAADAGRLRGEPGRLATPGQAAGGRALGELAGRGGAPAADTNVPRLEGRRAHAERGGERAAGPGRVVDWGRFAGAVERWERRLGRPAPAPTENGRLSARFSEWLMGLPDGWVTDVPGLNRADQLRAIGNGVCPPQAAAALRLLQHAALEPAA